MLIYTLLRLALFAAATAALWLVGMHSWLAPLVALAIAWMLGYLLLDKQRERAAAYLQARAEAAPPRAKTAAERDAELEDEIDEASRQDPSA